MIWVVQFGCQDMTSEIGHVYLADQLESTNSLTLSVLAIQDFGFLGVIYR